MRKDEFPIVDKFVKDSINEVLDKIRAEIQNRPSCMLSTSREYERGVNAMLSQALLIIEKYRAESEE
jgi:hypothetical protein